MSKEREIGNACKIGLIKAAIYTITFDVIQKDHETVRTRVWVLTPSNFKTDLKADLEASQFWSSLNL